MSFKTILVHCDNDRSLAQRLSVATDLAGGSGGHLVGLHVRPPFQPSVYFDTSYGVEELFELYQKTTAADQKAVSGAFAAATDGRNIDVERLIVEGPVDRELIRRARYADLVVLGQSHRDTPAATPSSLPEVVALAAGRPVLIVPYIEIRRPVGRNILLCWNDTRESARAAADALPLLRKADKVTVLAFRTGQAETGAQAAAEWLGVHGVKASAIEEAAADVDVGDLILSQAADLAADLVVMGLYGHTRVRELVMGGASRTVLKSMTVPVLMAH